MIQTVVFRVRFEGQDRFDDLAARIEKMVPLRRNVLGAQAIRDGHTVVLTMRMSALDRWKISAESRQVASYLLSATGHSFVRPLAPQLVTTELTRNKLCDGEGRTPRVRPPRRVTAGQTA